VTLNELIDIHRIAKIDLLYLNTEEFELPILKGIDLTKFRPKLIVVEIFDLGKNFFESINKYLSSYSYKFLEKIPNSNDYIFSC